MSYLTVEVEIDHGRVVPRGLERLPDKGSGLLTILPPGGTPGSVAQPIRQRVELPLIRGDGHRIINPTPEERESGLTFDTLGPGDDDPKVNEIDLFSLCPLVRSA